jgi:hypothetical protein
MIILIDEPVALAFTMISINNFCASFFYWYDCLLVVHYCYSTLQYYSRKIIHLVSCLSELGKSPALGCKCRAGIEPRPEGRRAWFLISPSLAQIILSLYTPHYFIIFFSTIVYCTSFLTSLYFLSTSWLKK